MKIKVKDKVEATHGNENAGGDNVLGVKVRDKNDVKNEVQKEVKVEVEDVGEDEGHGEDEDGGEVGD